MSADTPWMLVLVEGPSEVGEDDDRAGVVTKIIESNFGAECARGVTCMYWRHVPRAPSRELSPSLKGHGRLAEKAWLVSRMGAAKAAFGTVILLDNDRRDERLDALEAGVKASGCAESTAYGVAREMLEAWLLADPELLDEPLPPGKTCEALWGKKSDPDSNHPKQVLRRCVLAPRGRTFHEAAEEWNPDRARSNAASLDDFMAQVERLAKSKDMG